MEYIQIPIPDFQFEDIIKIKADRIIKTSLSANNIAMPFGPDNKSIENNIEKVLYDFPTNEVKQRIFFVNEIIKHVYVTREEFDKNKVYINTTDKIRHERDIQWHKERVNRFNELLLFLYNLLGKENIVVSNDIFTIEEAQDINIKLNSIIEVLDILKMGHEALGEEIQEVKDQIRSLDNSISLGKKSFFQRATGMAIHFATDKTFEVIWEPIKPQFSNLLINKISKLLSDFFLLST